MHPDRKGQDHRRRALGEKRSAVMGRGEGGRGGGLPQGEGEEGQGGGSTPQRPLHHGALKPAFT